MSENTSMKRDSLPPGLDHIEPAELVSLLWSRRRYIVIVTVLGLIGSLLFVFLKPDPPVTYTGYARLHIGKVAGVNVQSPGDTHAYIESDAFMDVMPVSRNFNISFRDLDKEMFPGKRRGTAFNTHFLSLSITTGTEEQSKKAIDKAVNTLMNTHTKLYEEAMEELEAARDNVKPIDEKKAQVLPFLWIDSYTYPTEVITGPDVRVNKPDENKAVQVVVTTFSALAIAIIMTILIEAVRSWRKREQKEGHS